MLYRERYPFKEGTDKSNDGDLSEEIRLNMYIRDKIQGMQ